MGTAGPARRHPRGSRCGSSCEGPWAEAPRSEPQHDRNRGFLADPTQARQTPSLRGEDGGSGSPTAVCEPEARESADRPGTPRSAQPQLFTVTRLTPPSLPKLPPSSVAGRWLCQDCPPGARAQVGTKSPGRRGLWEPPGAGAQLCSSPLPCRGGHTGQCRHRLAPPGPTRRRRPDLPVDSLRAGASASPQTAVAPAPSLACPSLPGPRGLHSTAQRASPPSRPCYLTRETLRCLSRVCGQVTPPGALLPGVPAGCKGWPRAQGPERARWRGVGGAEQTDTCLQAKLRMDTHSDRGHLD